jgi:hypothetical protein
MKARLLFLLGMLAAVALSADTTSGVATCTPEPPSPVALTDKPNHSLAIGKSQCGWTGFELGGLASKSGVATDLQEITGDSSATVRGYFVSTMINGDMTVARYQGSARMKDGKFASGGGNWTFTSGTGKMKGITGKGTFKGTPNPDGTISFKVDGEYRLP